MTMPFRWSLLVFLVLLLISLLTLSKLVTTKSSAENKSSLILHQLQEEQHLRSRNAQIRQDLEENDLQFELDCILPSSITDSSTSLTSEEKSLQEADFELELSLEIQRLIQKHRYDSTELNESPSYLQRQLERKLRNQKRLLSAYKASFRQKAIQVYSSQECVAWRAKQRKLEIQQKQDHLLNQYATPDLQKTFHAGNALARYKQFHPTRHNIKSDSIFAQTLNALAQKHYTDASGYIIELDPSKIVAGSRRASSYQNDDIHVLVLDMQWDPEVTVVVGNVLDETLKLRQEGYRPVMLNVGNSQVPGGDYHLDSVKDNEADLFRRTTLYQCLDQEPRRSRFYPLLDDGGVYCPNQAVFRHGLDKGNEFMDRFEWISVVSVSSIPKLETREKEGGLGGVQFLEGEDDILRRRILAAMKVGVSQGHDALVLPPHGTEIGQNPSEAIAAIYRSIIGRDFMGGRKRFQTYKKIVMVLDPEQADKVVNETSSYRPLFPINSAVPPTTSPLPVQTETINPEKNSEAKSEEDTESIILLGNSGQGPDLIISKTQDEDNQEYYGDDDDDEIKDSLIQDEKTANKDDDAQDSDNEEASSDENEDANSEDIIEVGNTEDLLDEFVLEEEVSETEALLEEQDLNEEANLPEEELEEDLSDISLKVELDSSVEKSENQEEDRVIETEDTVSYDENENEEEKEEEKSDGQKAEEQYGQITETVRQVFERMLEMRSLLIVKNRARGLPDPETTNSTDAANSSNTTIQISVPVPSAA